MEMIGAGVLLRVSVRFKFGHDDNTLVILLKKVCEKKFLWFLELRDKEEDLYN